MGWYIKTAIPPNESIGGCLSQENATENLSDPESLTQILLTDPYALNTHGLPNHICGTL